MTDLMKLTRRSLPKFAKSLAPDAITPQQLRTAVRDEIKLYYKHQNPLTDKQIVALEKWLDAT